MFARLSSMPLFWQVFATNALALVLALLGLIFLPVTVSVPPHATELVVLLVGLLVVLAINLVHVTSWSVCEGLFDGARRHLKPEGILFMYGPFKQNGGFTAPENAALDAALRAKNPDWGLRDLEAVAALGNVRGLYAEQVVDLDGACLGVVFRKQPDN